MVIFYELLRKFRGWRVIALLLCHRELFLKYITCNYLNVEVKIQRLCVYVCILHILSLYEICT